MNHWDRFILTAAYIFMVVAIAVGYRSVQQLITDDDARSCDTATLYRDAAVAVGDASPTAIAGLNAIVDVECA